MISGSRSPLLIKALYGATAVLVVAGLALQLAPRREARAANDSTSVGPFVPAGPAADTGSQTVSEPVDSPSNVLPGDILPGEFQAIVVSNIFSPQRTPPRARYRPRGTGEVEPARPPPIRAAPRAPRLFGVTLRPSGAVALIDADPAVPGAEIYRVGDAIAGGLLVEIGASTVTIERNGVRQIIRLESEPKRVDQ